MHDADLVTAFRNGRKEAFDELVRRYAKPLTLMILRMVRDEEEAKDLSQAAFLKAYQGLPRFMRASSFKTWLWSIGINAAKDHLRKRKHESDAEVTDHLEDPAESPAEQLDSARNSARLRKLVAELPEKQRLTLQLRVYEGMDYKAIATVLGGSEGGARVNFFQAAKTLREKLGSEP